MTKQEKEARKKELLSEERKINEAMFLFIEDGTKNSKYIEFEGKGVKYKYNTIWSPLDLMAERKDEIRLEYSRLCGRKRGYVDDSSLRQCRVCL